MAKQSQETELKPEHYLAIIRKAFVEAGDPQRAEGQRKYMREKFDYCGLKAPEWVAILKELHAEYGMYPYPEVCDFVRLCFGEEYRELHYAGLQTLEKQMRKLPEGAIAFLEECALTHSWWDTVDWINKFVGVHFRRYPQLQKPTCETWSNSGNIWLQRLTMIHQLTYRENTDQRLMFDMILKYQGSKDFFLQKGAGWALRQYSKTNGNAVLDFVGSHPELAPLTRREALKWLNRHRS